MISPSELRAAAEALRAGKLVAFPTETVYGLGANALDAQAVARIFAAKGRPSTSPLIVHVASLEQARGLSAEWPRAAQSLAERFWPGPLTLVVSKHPSIPDIVTAGLQTVGLRMPANDIALALIREAGVPVAAPSANRFTELSPTRAEHVRASLGDRVEIIVDGGASQVGIESTVIALNGALPRLLRPGMISRAEMEAIIGPIANAPESAGAVHESPGQHARHYQPRTPLMVRVAGLLPSRGRGAFLYWHQPAAPEISCVMPADPHGYAARLYDVLHDLDSLEFDWIGVEPVPPTADWDAIRDRLQRASAQ